MFDTTQANTKRDIDTLMANIKTISSVPTFELIAKFIALFRDSASVFTITTGFGICGGTRGNPRYARITLRIRHIASNRYYIVEHDRYLDGINKSKTSWVSNENWLAKNAQIPWADQSPIHFSKTKWEDVVQFVNYVSGT